MRRGRTPLETLKVISPYLESFGITRVADLSYLDDSSSLFVHSAIRPLSKSLTVSMGKSQDKDSSKCAAILESIESYHAEEVKPSLNNVSSEEILLRGKALDINAFSRGRIFEKTYKLGWQIGASLLYGEEVFIPISMISLDTTSVANVMYGCNSDGLATGNTFKEAIVVSFFENVERTVSKTGKKNNLNVPHKFLEEYNLRSDLNVYFYQYVNDFFPVVECVVQTKNSLLNKVNFRGVGCADNTIHAATKALEEALQSKIGIISGARDDIAKADYAFHMYNKEPYKKNTPDAFFEKEKLSDVETILESVKSMLIKQKKDLVFYVLLKEGITILRSYIVDEKSYI